VEHRPGDDEKVPDGVAVGQPLPAVENQAAGVGEAAEHKQDQASGGNDGGDVTVRGSDITISDIDTRTLRTASSDRSSGDVLIDDSYNASPESAQAALSVLGASAGGKVFVLGDMGELGVAAASMHAELGRFARRAGVDHLLALGTLSAEAVRTFGPGGEHFRDVDSLLEALLPHLDGTTTVLVKGSRFMRMERIVRSLTGEAITSTGGAS